MSLDIRKIVLMAGIGIHASLGLFISAVRIFALSARTPKPEDEISSSILGGVLNYRTRKLDDGTDPYGWYEQD